MGYPIFVNFIRKPIKFCNSDRKFVLLVLVFCKLWESKDEKNWQFFVLRWLIFAGPDTCYAWCVATSRLNTNDTHLINISHVVIKWFPQYNGTIIVLNSFVCWPLCVIILLSGLLLVKGLTSTIQTWVYIHQILDIGVSACSWQYWLPLK